MDEDEKNDDIQVFQGEICRKEERSRCGFVCLSGVLLFLFSFFSPISGYPINIPLCFMSCMLCHVMLCISS